MLLQHFQEHSDRQNFLINNICCIRMKQILTGEMLEMNLSAFASLSWASWNVKLGLPVTSQVHTIALHSTRRSQYSLYKREIHTVTDFKY